MIRWGQLSLTFRLTLLFSVVSTSVLLVLGVVVGILVEQHFQELDDENLRARVAMAQQLLEHSGGWGEWARMESDASEGSMTGELSGVALVNRQGQELISLGRVRFPADLLRATIKKATATASWVDQNHQSWRGMAVRLSSTRAAPAFAILVALDGEHHVRFMHEFREALWTIMAIAALFSGFLGWAMAKKGLAPLRDICRQAETISAQCLAERLSSTDSPPELGEVVKTFNGMLARLQASFERLEAFSSDIAHELRTPVSNLLTQTQVTLSKSRTVDTYRDILASNAEEFERLSRMIADMLFLAKEDHALVIPNPETVNLYAEVYALFEFYEAMAEEKQIQMTLKGEAMICGDRLMLRRAISNLLSNALKYTPCGGWVHVFIQAEQQGVRLIVENSGEPVSAEHLPHLFDRFYRADSARRDGGEGVGLGLAITRAIMRAHAGDVRVHTDNNTMSFELHFA